MRVLVIGSGGREYAMVSALSKASSVEKIFSIPGSSAIFELSSSVDADLKDHASVFDACLKDNIDLVAFGPEAPLVDGLSDFLREKGLSVFGPDKYGSMLEGDKLFAKDFMKEFDIPTGDFIKVSSRKTLEEALANTSWETLVFKYKDLAGGKGVLVSQSKKEILSFAESFGVNENQTEVVGYLEEPLYGWELSYICVINETGYEVCPILQDHKRLKENDEGPNTGGMGVVGPLNISSELESEIKTKIVAPTLEGLKKRNSLYRGVVYFGIMVTEDGPKVLEYNVRFGDPEAQLIFPLTKTDWGNVFKNVAEGKSFKLPEAESFGACVVLAAPGYPEKPVKGGVITGGKPSENLYHAGTKKEGSDWKVNGGRVLNVLGFGEDLKTAIDKAYENLDSVSFSDMQFRKDIGKKVL